MTLDRYAGAIDGCDPGPGAIDGCDPGPGAIETAELVVTDDVLVKLFVLGPDAELDPHEHPGATNVFHVLDGEVTVLRDGSTEPVSAPGVVLHERGTVHGARNDTDAPVAFTASLAPLE